MKGRLRIEPHGSRKEGKKGMFMDYICLIIFMNLFILMSHTLDTIVLNYGVNTIDINETQSMEHVRYYDLHCPPWLRINVTRSVEHVRYLRSPLSAMAECRYCSMEHVRYLRSP